MLTKFKKGQQVKVFVSFGYMGKNKEQRNGIIKEVICTEQEIHYLVETKTKTGRVSIIKRGEKEIIELSSDVNNKVIDICKSIISIVGLSGLKELNISTSDIKFLEQTNLFN